MTDAALWDFVQPFSLSLSLGALVGIERERAHAGHPSSMGVRSFMILGLLGFLAAWTRPSELSVGLTAFAFLLLLASYFRSKDASGEVGMTTELGAAAIFGAAYLSVTETRSSLLIGVTTLGLLYARQALHRFAKDVLRAEEIRAGIILLVFIVGLVPLFPNEAVDPWGILVPRKFALLLAFIAGLQFAAYVARRLFGERAGAALTGLFGGFVSSTAVYLSLPREDVRRSLVTGAFAIVATLLELLIVLGAASWKLTLELLPAVGALILAAAASGFVLNGKGQASVAREEGPRDRSPLDIRSALKLAVMVALLLALTSVAKLALDGVAVSWIAFLSGLFELQGASLAMATLASSGTMTLAEAKFAVGLAVVASFVSKIAILWFRDRSGKLSLWGSAHLVGVLSVGVAVWFLF